MPADRALRIGIGGPVGSGKSSLVAALCRALGDELRIGVVTNDIYTTEDAESQPSRLTIQIVHQGLRGFKKSLLDGF